MARTRPSKYTLTNEPAIKRMLFQERVKALERSLAVVEAQLARADRADKWEHFLSKQQEVQRWLERARRALKRSQAREAGT
jgi:hypothetical protein